MHLGTEPLTTIWSHRVRPAVIYDDPVKFHTWAPSPLRRSGRTQGSYISFLRRAWRRSPALHRIWRKACWSSLPLAEFVGPHGVLKLKLQYPMRLTEYPKRLSVKVLAALFSAWRRGCRCSLPPVEFLIPHVVLHLVVEYPMRLLVELTNPREALHLMVGRFTRVSPRVRTVFFST